jgi:hypothetical protein
VTKLCVFGRQLLVAHEEGGWRVYLMGADGKKRLAPEIPIPSHITEPELQGYLEDFLHEFASPNGDQSD